MLDPERMEHQFFQREGEFLAEVQPVEGRIVSSVIPDFWIRLAWLDPDRLPDEDACFDEILSAA